MRNQLLRCVMVAVGLTGWVLITPAHAQIGSARYSSIVVDASIAGETLQDLATP